MLNLRFVILPLAFSVAVFSNATAQQKKTWPTEKWTTSTPSAEGVDPEPLNELHKRISAGDFGNVDDILVIRNGKIVFEKTYARDYQKLNAAKAKPHDQYNYHDSAWHPFYRKSKLHSLQSVTKSVTAMAIGIAISRKEVSGVDARIVDLFKDVDILNNDERKKRLTLKNLLTMRSGIEWNESLPYANPNNSCTQLEASKDWFEFVIHLPLDTEPGTKFEYNSGASLLLSAIIKEKTGMPIDKYLDQHLFQPIGIKSHYWKKTPTGLRDTEGGLYLTAHDLAKIGYLCLNEGEWDGKQILSKEWVQSMVSPHVKDVAPENDSSNAAYGFQWWLFRDRENPDELTYACLGFGGQYLLVSPKHDLIIVATGWNIEQRPLPVGTVLNAVLNAVKGK